MSDQIVKTKTREINILVKTNADDFKPLIDNLNAAVQAICDFKLKVTTETIKSCSIEENPLEMNPLDHQPETPSLD